MFEHLVSLMIALDHLARYTPELVFRLVYLGYVDLDMIGKESPKSLWLTEEE